MDGKYPQINQTQNLLQRRQIEFHRQKNYETFFFFFFQAFVCMHVVENLLHTNYIYTHTRQFLLLYGVVTKSETSKVTPCFKYMEMM